MGNRFKEKVVEEGLVEVGGQRPEAEGQKTEAVDQRPVEDDSTAPDAQSRKGSKHRGDRAAHGLGRVLGGDMLADRLVLRQIPLLLLCLFYLLLIVGNRYRVESLSREKAATEERINFLREHRIQMQKQYQQSVKISQIAEELKESGVGITSGPPYEI